MNRALLKRTEAERADEELFVANVLRAIREEEALDMDEQQHIKELHAPEWVAVAYVILIFAAARVSLAIAAWLGGVL